MSANEASSSEYSTGRRELARRGAIESVLPTMRLHGRLIQLASILVVLATGNLARAQFDIMGACCLPDGSCQFLASSDCSNQGGGSWHLLTSCNDVICGACCGLDGVCAPSSSTLCDFQFKGQGSVCTGDCPQPGACCMGDGTCQERQNLECLSVGGVFGGQGSVCPGGCFGACCMPDGACCDHLEADCIAEGGVFQGVGANCTTDGCPQPTGACCLASGICSDNIVELVCKRDNCGFYQGDGTVCTNGLCPAFETPSNDTCETAIDIGDGTVTGDNCGAGTSVVATACDGFGAPCADIWYRYTAPADGLATVTACGEQAEDVIISVFCECPGNSCNDICSDGSCVGNEIWCAAGQGCFETPDRYASNANRSNLPDGQFNVTAGEDYFIRLASWRESPGSMGLTIISQASAAVIRQPQNQVKVVGASASFRVSATAAPESLLQWRKDGIDLPGETASTLFIPAVSAADAGQYSCCVANCGEPLELVTSSAVLTVLQIATTPSFVLADLASVGANPVDLTAAQLNSDRLDDLAVVNNGADSVSILLAGVNGTFGPAAAVSLCDVENDCQAVPLCTAIPPELDVRSVVSSAANGPDKFLDVLVATAVGTLSLRNLGDGSFEAGTATLSSDPQVDLLVADVNNQGIPDVLALTAPDTGTQGVISSKTQARAESRGGVVTRLGDGSASGSGVNGSDYGIENFAPLVELPEPSLGFAAADFFGADCCGANDLVLAVPSTTQGEIVTTGQLVFYDNLGVGVDSCLGRPSAPFLGWQEAGAIVVGPTPADVVAADFDGDGLPDVAVANRDGHSVSVWLNQSDVPLNFVLHDEVMVGFAPVALVVADLDGDGDRDLASVNFGSDSVSVLANDGLGGMEVVQTVLLPAGSAPSSIESGDFNGDGLPDLAVTASGTDSVAILLNNMLGAVADCNTNAVADPLDITLGNSTDYNSNGLLDECENPADLNGDGIADLTDHGNFADCLGGPDNSTPPAGCTPGQFLRADLELDIDVDLRDFAGFERSLTP